MQNEPKQTEGHIRHLGYPLLTPGLEPKIDMIISSHSIHISSLYTD